MTIGTTLTRRDFPNSPITIKDIITHKRESGKRVKLDRPIYVMSYLNEDKRDFETNLTEIEKQISYNLWIVQ